MPKLTVEAIGSNINIQDPFPAEGVLAIQAVPGTPEERYVTFSQFQRIRDQLTSLEELGVCQYTVEASDKDARADEADLIGLPAVDGLDTSASPFSQGAGATTGAKIAGTNLNAGQTKAAVTMGDPTAPNGHIEFEAIIPGADGNEISIEFLNGAAESINIVANKIEITLDSGVSTFLSIETLVNAHASAKYMVLATKGGTGADVISTAYEGIETFLEGGQGAGVAIDIGGTAGVISEVKDDGTEITYDFDVSTLTVGDQAVFTLRSGTKLNRLCVEIVA